MKKNFMLLFSLMLLMLINIPSAHAAGNNPSNVYGVKSGQYILMTREEFRNWLFQNQFTRKISVIQQHHTWKPSYMHFHGSNHFMMLSGIENFHVKQMGWKMIAQNITTFPDGKVAVCRPFEIAPIGL